MSSRLYTKHAAKTVALKCKTNGGLNRGPLDSLSKSKLPIPMINDRVPGVHKHLPKKHYVKLLGRHNCTNTHVRAFFYGAQVKSRWLNVEHGSAAVKGDPDGSHGGDGCAREDIACVVGVDLRAWDSGVERGCLGRWEVDVGCLGVDEDVVDAFGDYCIVIGEGEALSRSQTLSL